MRAHPTGRFRAFDGLRAAAALIVVAYHVCEYTGLGHSGLLAPLAGGLNAGVTIFFVISGFVLYLPYARAIRAGAPPPDWRAYANRRAVRILPAYWVALTLVGLVGPLAGSVLTADSWRYFGLTQTYNPDTLLGGLPGAWSLCVEISFYAVLPLLARGLARLVERRAEDERARIQLAACVAIALGSLGLRTALCHSLVAPIPHPGVVLGTNLPGMADWFAIGIAFAVVAVEWERDPARFRRLAALASRPACCWTLAVGCYIAGVAIRPGDEFLSLYGTGTHMAFGLAAGLFVLPALRSPRTAGISMLTARPVVWLGTVSYGIYLWQKPVLESITGTTVPVHAAGPLHVLGVAALVVVGASALAAASWYLVERPVQRLARRDLSATARDNPDQSRSDDSQIGRASATVPAAPPARAAYDSP